MLAFTGLSLFTRSLAHAFLVLYIVSTSIISIQLLSEVKLLQMTALFRRCLKAISLYADYNQERLLNVSSFLL